MQTQSRNRGIQVSSCGLLSVPYAMGLPLLQSDNENSLCGSSWQAVLSV
jgi:hypothetical protein